MTAAQSDDDLRHAEEVEDSLIEEADRIRQDESSVAQVRCGRVVDPDATYPHPCVLPEGHDGPCDPRPPEMRSAASPSPDDLIDLLGEVRDSLIWHASNVPLSRREHGPVLTKIDEMTVRLAETSFRAKLAERGWDDSCT